MTLLTLLRSAFSSAPTAFYAPPSVARTLTITETSSSGLAYRQQPDGVPIIAHSSSASLDYTLDWTSWLATGETIASATITADPGIAVGADNLYPLSRPMQVQIWLVDGVAGTTYLISALITTSYGRIDERSFRAQVMLR